MDDLVGGIFRLGNAASMGIGRTDSEAAFQVGCRGMVCFRGGPRQRHANSAAMWHRPQHEASPPPCNLPPVGPQEFLKRIPSASNLAAIAGSAGQLAPPSALDATALPLHDTSAGGPSGLGGIPRVSSLDFLARLVNGHQSFSAPAQPAASSAQAPPSQPAPGPAHVPPIKMEPGEKSAGMGRAVGLVTKSLVSGIQRTFACTGARGVGHAAAFRHWQVLSLIPAPFRAPCSELEPGSEPSGHRGLPECVEPGSAFGNARVNWSQPTCSSSAHEPSGSSSCGPAAPRPVGPALAPQPATTDAGSHAAPVDNQQKRRGGGQE